MSTGSGRSEAKKIQGWCPHQETLHSRWHVVFKKGDRKMTVERSVRGKFIAAPKKRPGVPITKKEGGQNKWFMRKQGARETRNEGQRAVV